MFLRNSIVGLALVEQHKVKGASNVGISIGEADSLVKGHNSLWGSIGGKGGGGLNELGETFVDMVAQLLSRVIF